jgi:PAS domain S-box-containing protein
MNPSPGRVPLIALVAALAIIGAISTLAYVSLQSLVGRMQSVAHTQEVLRETELVISYLKDVETGDRGYLISREAEFLAIYRNAVAKIPSHLDRLKELTADNAEQQERVRQLEQLAHTRLERAALFLKTADTARIVVPAAARAHILAGKETLFAQRTQESTRSSRHSAAVIIAGAAASSAILVAAFLVSRRQIRQRALAQRQAHEHAVEVENLYNHAPCGYHSVDRNGVFVRINDTELSWLGYKREEVIGKLKFVDIVTPECKQTVLENFPRLVRGGITANLEYKLQRKDGTTLPVSVNAVPMLDADGNFVMSRTTMFDITALKEVENQIRLSNAFLDAVVENIPSMIFVKEAKDLRFVRINKAEEDFLGIPREKLLGKTDYDFFPVEQSDFFTSKDREVLQDKGVLHVFEEQLTTNGLTRHLRTRKIGLRNDDGMPQYLLGISEDITEQKLAEQAIRELNIDLQMRANQLEAANKELESFSYSVSHDLRAPLRAIDGFTRIFEEDYGAGVDDEGRRLLTVIRDNSKRMGVLIDDLLAFSRLGRQSLSTEPIEMSALVQAALAEIRGAGAHSGAEVLVQPLPGVHADPVLLRQVWVNLLSNALKYSSTRAAPNIEVGFVAATDSEDYLTYFVKDNGVGFDMRYYDKLFGVFQRLHGTDEFTGTGVGLAIVHRLITRHGGRVWAEAELDKGATFFFSLPAGGPT